MERAGTYPDFENHQRDAVEVDEFPKMLDVTPHLRYGNWLHKLWNRFC